MSYKHIHSAVVDNLSSQNNIYVGGTLNVSNMQVTSLSATGHYNNLYTPTFSPSGYFTVTQNINGKPDDIIPADGPTTRTNLGLGTSNNVEFAGLELASDTITLNDGDCSIEFDNPVFHWTPTGKNKNITAQETTPHGLYFSSNGSYMYVVGHTNKTVYRYSLSAAWDVTSATNDSSYSVTSQDANPSDLYFSPDGLDMFTVGYQNDRVYHYKLTTPWDISTGVTYVGFLTITGEATPMAIEFKPDGTQMYIVGYTADTIRQYTLSAGFGPDFNIASALSTQSLNIASLGGDPQGLRFSSDGFRMYYLESGSERIGEFWLTEAYQLSSATFKYWCFYPAFTTGTSSFIALDNAPTGLYINESINKAYYLGVQYDTVYEIDISKQLTNYTGHQYTRGRILSESDIRGHRIFVGNADTVSLNAVGGVGVDLRVQSGGTTLFNATAGGVFAVFGSGTTPTYQFGSLNTGLVGEGTGAIHQRSGTTAQTYRLYRTYTDASNYQRLTLNTSASAFNMAAESTSVSNVDLNLLPQGTGKAKTTALEATTDVQVVGGNYEVDFSSLYGSALQLRVNETLVTPVTGLSALATNLIPAGAMVLGTLVRVVSGITSDTGTTFSIGDESDIDKWGSGIAYTLNTTSSASNFTVLTPTLYTTTSSVVLTPDSGSFTGGQVRVAVHYMSFTAPTL